MSTYEQTLYDQLQTYLITKQDAFYRLAFSYVNNHEIALDVVQDAIIKAVTKLHTLKQPEYMKTWFYRILINECISTLRKEKRFYHFQTEVIRPPILTEDATNALGDSIDLYSAIHSLEPKLKTVIILRYYEDLKIHEIAQITKTNENTVKTRLYKALNKLKHDLGKE